MSTQVKTPYAELLEFLNSTDSAVRVRVIEGSSNRFCSIEVWLINSRTIVIMRDSRHGSFTVFFPATESLEIDADINAIKHYCEV